MRLPECPYEHLAVAPAVDTQEYTGAVIYETLGRRVSPSLSRAHQRLLRCRQMTNSPPRAEASGGLLVPSDSVYSTLSIRAVAASLANDAFYSEPDRDDSRLREAPRSGRHRLRRNVAVNQFRNRVRSWCTLAEAGQSLAQRFD